jgi:glycosyltransferase involved in cell wall biosynthesis
MEPIRIGVNALYMIPGGVGGTEIYLRSLLAALAEIDRHNQYIIFTNAETGSDLVPRRSNFTQAPQRVRAAMRPARILWEQTILPWEVARRRIDVLFNPGFTAPVLGLCPNITVMYDLQHKRHPEHFRWFDLPFWRFMLWAAVRRSRSLITISQASKQDLVHYYRVSENRIVVTHPGVEQALFEIGRRREERPFLLCVSTLHPHKNLDKLLEAFAEFSKTHPEFRLICAGLRGFYTEQLERLRASLGLEDRVTFTGWIPREQLYELFASASAFIYPSRFEGFGMPILEAMAAAIPTACSNVEPMKSVAGDAALQFDPGDVCDIRRAIESILFDKPLRERLKREGPARAAQFTWRASARVTLDALLGAA